MRSATSVNQIAPSEYFAPADRSPLTHRLSNHFRNEYSQKILSDQILISTLEQKLKYLKMIPASFLQYNTIQRYSVWMDGWMDRWGENYRLLSKCLKNK